MKFDFIIGNPPYQEEQEGDNLTFAPPIYHKFIDEAYELAGAVELIHPARFLFNAGSTPREWNKKMLKDKHFKILYYEEDASRIFPSTMIKGGIAISYRDKNRNFGAIGVFTKHKELSDIMHKASPKSPDNAMSNFIYNQNRFNLDVLYQAHPEYRNIIGGNGHDTRFRNNIFDKLTVFHEERQHKTDVPVLGVIKNKRTQRYIAQEFVDKKHINYKCWKVLLSSAVGTGTLGETLGQTVILAPNECYTQTFIGVGALHSQSEALAVEKYIKTKFCRTLLGVLKITHHITPDCFRHVPLQDFTPSSDIDWTQPVAGIDRQLYAKYGLSDEEINFIETHVKEMA